MLRLLKALAVVLAVPLVCAAMAYNARETLDHRWQASLRRPFLLRRQMPDERLIARYSLGVVCADSRRAATIRPCRPYTLFNRMALASLATAGLGAAFLGGLVLAARASRQRRRLVRLFRPALYAAVGGLVLLMLLHGALGIASVYLVGEIIEGWPAFMVFAAAVAAFLAVLSMAQAAAGLARRARLRVVGRPVDVVAHPRLRAFLSDVCAAVGSGVPATVVAGLGPECFLTEARVVTLQGPAAGRTLYLSLALARILSVEELKGLVAHECAHFGGGDEEASGSFYPVYAGITRTIAQLGAHARGPRSFVNLPARWVLTAFLHWFTPDEAPHARARELHADAGAARVVGARALSSALLKAHAFAPAWHEVLDAMERAVSSGTQYVNASELFAQAVADNASREHLAAAGDLALWHPTDVFPPLAERLAALGVRPSEVASAALDTRPPTPAASLFDNHELLERDLSEAEHRILALARERQ